MSKNIKKTNKTDNTEAKQQVATPAVANETVTQNAVTNKNIKSKKKVSQRNAIRYNPKYDVGLSSEEVDERISNGLTNNVKAKNSKSIPAIIIGNTFTFFNLLCALVIVAYVTVSADLGNFTFILPFAINLIIGIFQEIRAKLSIEKLSILQAPITKVIRNGVEFEIPTKDIVLDDVFKVTSGNQIPVDGIVLDGFAEVN